MQVPGATTLSAKLRQRRGEPAAVWAFTNRLGGERFEYTPASAGLRLVAGLTDLAVLLLLLALLAPGVEEVFRNLLTHDPYAGMVVAGMAWGVGLLGLTTSYGLRGQTPGQWWWGLMICRMDGREVWFGRAFVSKDLANGSLRPNLRKDGWIS